MSISAFVGRINEISRLREYLDRATNGAMQVVFIAGEAGAGKSTLVKEFIRQEEVADPKLIAAIGECNAQTGMADPYLPFREVLTALTLGNEDKKPVNGAEEIAKINRWREFVQVATKTLIMLGPDLVGIFVPGGQFITRIGTTIALNSNLHAKLSERIGKKSAKTDATIDTKLDQTRLFEQYTAVIKALAKDHTLILVLDDLQWADSGSLNLLFHLARNIHDSRVLLVGTYRPDDVAFGRDGGRHPLEPILNELKRYNGDIVMDLSNQESGEGRAFVDGYIDMEPNGLGGEFRDELFAHTGGHPLFTVELLQSLKEQGIIARDEEGKWNLGRKLEWKSLPARIDGVIGERIARLPADLHEILNTGSVIGEEFAAQVVASVNKVDEQEVVRKLSRELEKRFFLVSDQGEIRIGKQYLSQYRFTHVLLPDYLTELLSSGERRILHHEIATTLEELYTENADEIALQLAWHFEAGGNEDKAIYYLSMAADEAYGKYAYTEAISTYSRALELGEEFEIPVEHLYHIYLHRGRAMELNNQYELAVQNYDEMISAAEKRHDQHMELAAKVAASTLFAMPTPVADASKAQSLSDETLALAKKLGDREAEAKVLWNLQLVNLLQNKAQEAIECGEESLRIAREMNLREQMAYVLSDLSWAYGVACQFDKANERMKEGVMLWKELDNKTMLSNALNTSLFQYYWTGKDDKALRVAEEAYELSKSISETWNQASARNFQGLIWLEYGEIDKGLSALKESVDLAKHGNHVYEIWYSAMLCQAYAELGAVDKGMEVYRASRVDNRDVPKTPARSSTLIYYALFELLSNQPEEAARTLAECSPDAPPWDCMHKIAKSKLAMAQANYDEAYELAEAALELAQKYNLGQYIAEAYWLKGKSLFKLDEAEKAKISLEQARTEAEHLGSRRLLWQIIAYQGLLASKHDGSSGLNGEAQKIVDYIADHITDEGLRRSFLEHARLDGEFD